MPKITYQEIVKAVIARKPKTETEFSAFARKEAALLHCPPVEKSKLLSAYHTLVKNKVLQADPNMAKFLTKRAIRTMSGVAVISVLTKPYPCPGNCLYCPTEEAMPKSYLSNEPAVMRAILNNFDPYKQIKMRLKALKANGHSTEKVELIVMGGTWSYHTLRYQSWFIKRCFEALNGRKALNLTQAQHTNETAKFRCIGLTLETRPDYITEPEIIQMRKLGCTRVELGIQHIDNDVLKLNRRGHTSAQSARAIELLRSAGFKINFHLMTGLPGSTPAKDLAMFKKIYTNPAWMPDMIKIYPCVVTANSDLYKWWKQKKYKPYTDKQLIDLLIKIKKNTPPYVRITRLIRDIPRESILAGNKITNLRQIIQNRSHQEGWSCKCIRCREVGHQDGGWQMADGKWKIKLNTITYKTMGGTEYFLSYESRDEKILYAFLRLRINDDKDNFIPELKDAAIIRELHTYGQMAEIGATGEVQHLGLGKKLLQEAEKITADNHLKTIAVISGIGVKKYYAKFGYAPAGNYMKKLL